MAINTGYARRAAEILISECSEEEIENGKDQRLLSVARWFPQIGDDTTILEDIESGMDQS